ncbi:MAG: phospholipase [Cyanobacteria bacterium]|nr:phospholipase [Cyanobacteriota bacterium]
MLHGRGAGPENILELVPRLARPQFQYVAPAAPNQTWYPFSFMAEIQKNEPHLSNALAQVKAAVEDAEKSGVPRNKIVFLGFSQGACLATEFMIRNAGAWGGLIAFSGGAIGPPGTAWATDGADGAEKSFGGMRMFFGCSDVDAHVPEARVRESAAICERMGATVTTRIYPGMGHLVNDDEITQAQKLLDTVG